MTSWVHALSFTLMRWSTIWFKLKTRLQLHRGFELNSWLHLTQHACCITIKTDRTEHISESNFEAKICQNGREFAAVDVAVAEGRADADGAGAGGARKHAGDALSKTIQDRYFSLDPKEEGNGPTDLQAIGQWKWAQVWNQPQLPYDPLNFASKQFWILIEFRKLPWLWLHKWVKTQKPLILIEILKKGNWSRVDSLAQ